MTVIFYLAVTGFLAFAALFIRRACHLVRDHNQRLASYEAARRDSAEWERVRRAIAAADADMPPEYDPLIVSNPRTPQRGEQPR